MRIHLIFAALALTIGCDNGPTQTTGVPIVPPSPAPVPPPPPPPAPPPSTAPWFGFIGTEADGFVAISALPKAIGSYPLAINDAGQVVGRVAYSDRADRAFIWSRADGMVDLGALSPGGWSEATAINSKGQVVGYSSTPSGRYHAFRWSTESGMVDLGLMAGCVASWAHGINNYGDVVGKCLVDGNTARMRPFLLTESRGMEDLGTAPGGNGVALAINDRLEVVGFDSPSSYYDDDWHAVLWNIYGGGNRLDNCRTSECSAWGTAINSKGDVAGSYSGNAFVWRQGGTNTSLGDLGTGTLGVATAINDARQIVGYSFKPAGGLSTAFTWTDDRGMRALALPPGKTEMMATGINNKGEIIGYSR